MIYDEKLFEIYDDKKSLKEIQKIQNIDEIKFLKSFAKYKNLDFIDLDSENINLNLMQKLPMSLLNDKNFILFKYDEKHYHIATAYTVPFSFLDRIGQCLKEKILKIHIAHPSQISFFIDEYLLKDKIQNLCFELKEELKNKSHKEQSAVSKLFELILNEAVRLKASDIHFEINSSEGLVRFRIDGLLTVFLKFEYEIYNALIFYIKLLANLNVAEQRKAQDSSFSMKIRACEYDFRFSSLPILYGETVVLRILERKETVLNLDELNFNKINLEKYKKSIALPHGLILLTGPTGSGKSTSLYASLNEIKDENKKIISAEDPIEYRLDMVQQIVLNEKIGLSFNNALRAILRQDPDVIMIGEIRDEQSLDIALKASLTGHLVFSTLHTNDAISAITRMIDMKAPPYLLSSALKVVIAQRLIRKLCKHCKIKNEDDEFYKASSCKRCNYTGYAGRELVSEFLFIDDEISELIRLNASKDEILKQARKNNFETMFENALKKASLGISSLDEIHRVLG